MAAVLLSQRVPRRTLGTEQPGAEAAVTGRESTLIRAARDLTALTRDAILRAWTVLPAARPLRRFALDTPTLGDGCSAPRRRFGLRARLRAAWPASLHLRPGDHLPDGGRHPEAGRPPHLLLWRGVRRHLGAPLPGARFRPPLPVRHRLPAGRGAALRALRPRHQLGGAPGLRRAGGSLRRPLLRLGPRLPALQGTHLGRRLHLAPPAAGDLPRPPAAHRGPPERGAGQRPARIRPSGAGGRPRLVGPPARPLPRSGGPRRLSPGEDPRLVPGASAAPPCRRFPRRRAPLALAEPADRLGEPPRRGDGPRHRPPAATGDPARRAGASPPARGTGRLARHGHLPRRSRRRPVAPRRPLPLRPLRPAPRREPPRQARLGAVPHPPGLHAHPLPGRGADQLQGAALSPAALPGGRAARRRSPRLPVVAARSLRSPRRRPPRPRAAERAAGNALQELGEDLVRERPLQGDRGPSRARREGRLRLLLGRLSPGLPLR